MIIDDYCGLMRLIVFYWDRVIRMNMEKMIPIEGEILGKLHGRDCIFVSSVT